MSRNIPFVWIGGSITGESPSESDILELKADVSVSGACRLVGSIRNADFVAGGCRSQGLLEVSEGVGPTSPIMGRSRRIDIDVDCRQQPPPLDSLHLADLFPSRRHRGNLPFPNMKP